MRRRSWLRTLRGIVSSVAHLLKDIRVIARVVVSAVAAMVSGSASDVWHIAGTKSDPSVDRTEIGEQKQSELADGSRITPNTNSKTVTEYTARARKVRLTGEALFDVRHNEGRPFTVCVGNGNVAVRDLGTHFSVKQVSMKQANASRVVVTVSEGSVLIEAGAKALRDCAASRSATRDPRSPMPAETNDEDLSLTANAGDQVDLTIVDGNASAKVKHLGIADVEAAHGWATGIVTIGSSGLQKALDEASRYSNKRYIAVPSVAHQRIRGTFPASSPESLLAGLRAMYGLVEVPAPAGTARDPDVIYIGPAPKAPQRTK